MRVRHEDPIKNARNNMVFSQMKTNGVVDKRILSTFERIPRENFVLAAFLPVAYGDGPVYCDIPGRYLFPPQTLGIILQQLNPLPNDKVLVVGGNYGYTATVLFELGCTAYVVEPEPILVAGCREKLKKYNAVIQNRSLTLGLDEHGPYQAIIIELGLGAVPDFVINQLQENGRVALCIAANPGPIKACILQKHGDTLQEIFKIDANMPLCTELIKPESFTF